jgi:hypothetical protein
VPGPISEDDFKAKVYLAHRVHFDHVFRLHRVAEGTMLSYRNQTVTAYEASLSLIFPRAFKSYDSIRRLCEIASCEDAAVILRSLLNLLVVTRWISLEPSVRAKKYLHWYWVQMHLDAQRLNGIVPPELVPFIQQKYDRVKTQFEYVDKKGKLKRATKWYEPEASNIRDLFVQVGLEKQYEEGYRPLSGVEHSDSTAFFAMVRGMDQTGTERRLEVQSDLFVPHYLRNAFQYFGDIFELCNRTIPLADDAELKAILAAGKAFYKADMEASGIPT